MLKLSVAVIYFCSNMAMFYSAEDVLKVMSEEDSNSDCYDDSVTRDSDDEYAVENNDILF